ncbi:MAG: hypothetical protein WC496_01085 [Phycisphaerae bacterium]|jgi:hypothetical protein
MSITKRQLIILDELFETGGDESAVLKRHNISRKLWAKWLAEEDFADEIAARMDALKRQSGMLISKYAPFAAAKLIELCGSENQETARKAALDIINLHRSQTQDTPDNEPPALPKLPSISPETASKLLSVLAENE